MRNLIIAALVAATAVLSQGCGAACTDSSCGNEGKVTCKDGSKPNEQGECPIDWTCPDGSVSVDGRCPVDCQDGSVPDPKTGKCYVSPTCPPPNVVRDGVCTYPYCAVASQVSSCFCDPSTQVLKPGTSPYYYCCAKTAHLVLPQCITCRDGKVLNPCTNTCEVPQ